MRNAGLIAAGIVGAVVLTAGIGFAMNGSDNRAPTELSFDAPTERVERVGMTEDEMNARIANERAIAQAQAAAKIDCERERQEASNTGAVVGGVAGAVVGSNVAGNGAKSEGGVIGALAGATVGRDIAKKDHRC
jgi:uncharacterized membrane protein